ncbi:MAG: MarR family transcriptional regulator [Cytophagaceae bacterium]|nr:MarR family transcriptional regulator [Cytophagaceae bacterium]
MELESEIKQKKFASEYQKAAVNILYTANWLTYSHTKFMKPYKISPQQYNILRILKGQHPNAASVNLLIDRMLDKMSNASRLVEKLKQKGLVERKQCEKDRRQVDVLITKKGLDLLEKLNKEFDQAEGDYLKNITKDEAKELNRILDKLRG